MTEPPEPFLRFDGVSKEFPGVRALDAVTFGAAEGEVHALLGENGAGKSTLLKVLSGSVRPDEGAVVLGGKRQAFLSTADALRAGVAVLSQELQLAPALSVAENVYLGHLPNRSGWVQRDRLEADTRRLLETLGEDIHPGACVASLPIAQRQMVEIAKALARDAKVIALDEPTSSLSGRETERLFAVISDLRREGRVILYVSHRMEEIFRIADAATVLRDGRHVESFARLDALTPSRLVSLMVGRALEDVYEYEERPLGENVLEAEGVRGPGIAAPASLTVARGEIVGLFGLVGAGRTELLRLLYGAVPRRAGSLRLGGEVVRPGSPRAAIRAGMALCPEDRKKEGIVPLRSVQENLNLGVRRRFSPLRFFIHPRREREHARRQTERLGIRASSPDQKVLHLSGGNQQKVVLGRALGEEVQVLLLDEPTRGIDVGARSEIYALLQGLARRGVGILMASSDLPEVLGLSDRVLVMREGMLVASLPRAEASAERVLQQALPTGERPEAIGAAR